MSDPATHIRPSRVVRGALKSIADRSHEPARRADARVGLTHAELAEAIAHDTEAAIDALRAEFLAAYADGAITAAEAASIRRRIEGARDSLRRL